MVAQNTLGLPRRDQRVYQFDHAGTVRATVGQIAQED